MTRCKKASRFGITLTFAALGGCAASPGVQLSAADSMELLAASLAIAIEEYRGDLEQVDADRQKSLVDAFVVRMRSDPYNEDAVAAHTAQFTAALDRLQADRRAASDRRHAAIENLETLREVAEGLRRVAVESMNLDDQARRFLTERFSHAPPPPLIRGD